MVQPYLHHFKHPRRLFVKILHPAYKTRWETFPKFQDKSVYTIQCQKLNEISLQTHKFSPFNKVSPQHVESAELIRHRAAGGGVTHLHEKVSHLVQLGLTWTPFRPAGRLLLIYKVTWQINGKEILQKAPSIL